MSEEDVLICTCMEVYKCTSSDTPLILEHIKKMADDSRNKVLPAILKT